MHLHLLLLQLLLSGPVDQDEVLAMMAKVPSVEIVPAGQKPRPGGWERRKDAAEAAAVISRVASSYKEAARMVVYAALEGGMSKAAVGDGGAAHGLWQLHGWCGLRSIEEQARCWVRLERKSLDLCQIIPEEERMAALASGNCDHGRILARRREAIVERVLEEVEEDAASRSAEERAEVDVELE